MTKLCPRGKAAAKRKFKVYPSAYANAYASKICAGKIKDPSGVKRKDFRGPKPAKAMGGRIFQNPNEPRKPKMGGRSTGLSRKAGTVRTPKETMLDRSRRKERERRGKMGTSRKPMMGGGMTMMPRAMYNKGGKIPTTPKEKTFAALAAPKDRITFADKIAGATGRQNKKGGGLMEATSRLKAQGLKMGGIARGCGAVMGDRRKKTKMY